MKKLTLLFAAIILMALNSNILSQGIPETINYQGILKDAAGAVVSNGDYNLTFKLYDVESGGSSIWSETKLISITNGIVNTQLGTITPIPPAIFNSAAWLGITVATGTELTPRIALTSVPYSIYSLNVPDGSITSTKIADDEVVKSVNGLKDNVNLVAGSNVTITPGGNNLTISSTGGGSGIGGSGTANYLPVFTNSTTLGNSILYQDGSRVGVNNSSPDFALTINSDPTAGLGLKLSRSNGGFGLSLLEDSEPTGLRGWFLEVYQQKLRIKTAGDNGFTTIKNLMTFERNGNIGIGTDAGDMKLSVHSNSGISYIRVSDNTSGPTSGLRMGMSGSGNAYIINDESNKSLSLGTSGTSQMRISDLGHVGINTLTPAIMLHLRQDMANRGLRIQHQSTADYWDNGIGTTTKNYKFYYNSLFRADISSVDGAYTQSSDGRLKKDIESMEPVLNKVAKLKPVTFHYTDFVGNGPKSTGFIAQDVELLFPDLVREGDEGYKGLVYDGFAVIAIKAIQEQQKIIDDLLKRIEALENK